MATAVVTGFCAAVVAWIVAISGVSTPRGGAIGFVFGLGVFLFVCFPDLVSLVKGHSFSGLSSVGMSFLFLPIGLGVIGLISAVLTNRIRL
jgi:hypothetical protein